MVALDAMARAVKTVKRVCLVALDVRVKLVAMDAKVHQAVRVNLDWRAFPA